jgi:regulator of replication initiation timing
LNEKYQENVTEPAKEQIPEKVEEVLVSERTRLDLEYEKLREKYFTSVVGDHTGFEETGA